MSDDLDQRLAASLTRRAEALLDPPRFSPDEIIRAGRRGVRRRRYLASGGTAVVVVLALLAGWLVLGRPAPDGHRPQPPAHSAAPSTAPPSTDSVPPLDTFNGKVILRADGSLVSLDLGVQIISSVDRIAGGWVVRGWTPDPLIDQVWFVPDRGTPRRIVSDRHVEGVMSADGRLYVVATANRLIAYALPSFTVVARHSKPDATLYLVAVSDSGRVLLGRMISPPVARPASVWDLHTGSFTTTSTKVWPMDVSGAGLALLRVERGTTVCVDVARLTGSLPTNATGFCGAEAPTIEQGRISPDGRWVLLRAADATDALWTDYLVTVADLHAGRWHPVTLPIHGSGYFWDTAGTVIIQPLPGQNDTEYYRCDTTGRCITLAGHPVAQHG